MVLFMRLSRIVSIGFTLSLLQFACRSPAEPRDLIVADGVMQRSVEGCFRIITSNRIFQPLSLASEFQVDGLAVHFQARLKPTFNTCQAGETVELLQIELRKDRTNCCRRKDE